MRAVRVHAFGGPDAMVVETVPDPAPGPGEALVRHAFVGVNFADVSQRAGRTRGGGTQYETDLPYTPGNEASGVVEAVGAGVEGIAAGDRVAYRGVFGAYAEAAAVPASSLVPVPDGLPMDVAAACLTHGMTAHYVTHDAHAVAGGEWILVHAAAGGTGALVVQMAKGRGATVVATASTAEKCAHAVACGADHAIDYVAADFEAACRALPGFDGFHAVLDNVSLDTFERNLRLLRPCGDLVIFGMSSGPIPPFDLQRLNGLGSLSIRRTNLRHYVPDRAALLRRAGAVLDMLARGEIRITVAGIHPLDRAGEAHAALAGRRTIGKVLLRP